MTPAGRARVRAIWGHRCLACGCTSMEPEFMTIHHLVPVGAGGDNSLHNLCVLCRTCHTLWHKCESRKTLTFPEWVAQRRRQLKLPHQHPLMPIPPEHSPAPPAPACCPACAARSIPPALRVTRWTWARLRPRLIQGLMKVTKSAGDLVESLDRLIGN